MKILTFLLILLDVRLSEELSTARSGEIVIIFDFPPEYTAALKTCCRLFPATCIPVMDTRGNVHDLYRGRVAVTEKKGSVEFRITHAGAGDGGVYRCFVQGTRFYRDYSVEITELSKLFPTSLVSTIPTILNKPQPSQPRFHQTSPISPLTFTMLLATSLSISTIALIGFVTGVVCCLRKKPKGKVVESQPDSSTPMSTDSSSIVYITVDFKSHLDPTIQLHANLERRASTAKPSHGLPRAIETVEYSTLAVRP